ncbi:MAG: TIGR04282 family arsenosugar biosynthesis glycosyltransferase [Nitrospirales bacterium]|nr:TIGR04282 family arsenosugar biosynthesis glycosyltransferase [Nitrospirales bacterium]
MKPSGNDPAVRRARPSYQRQGERRRSLTPATSAIIVFAKAPVAGQVKTRLCPPLTPDEAASLHGSLVLDMLERCQSLRGYDRILAGTPSPHHPFFRAMEARFKIPVWDQIGDDLGTRMASAFNQALGSPYRSVVVIGTDIPGINGPLLTTALESLHDHDVVLGPTMDGGYYLIGLRTPVPELFENIPWSTGQVYALTEQKVKMLGLSLKILPKLRDLDAVEDLHMCIRDLKDPQNQMFSSRTKNVLQELGKRLINRE